MQKNLNTNVHSGLTQKSKEIETVNHSPVKRQNETYLSMQWVLFNNNKKE